MGINIDSVYAGNTINAEWLKAEHGGKLRGVIDECVLKEYGGGDEPIERKVNVHFKGIEKVLSLNVTNKNRLKDMFGPETDKWIGREIELVIERVDYKSNRVDAVRVNDNYKPEPAKPTSGTTIGDAAAERLLNRIGAAKMSLNDLRYHLAITKNLGGMVDAHPSSWPADWVPIIGAWLNNPTKAPEGKGYTPISEEDIPFSPTHGI